MKRFSILTFLVAAGLILAACGGGAVSEPVTIKMEMSEYTFTPANVELKVGQVATFEFVNNGKLQHEIMFGHNLVKENNRPVGYEEDLFAVAIVEPQVTQDVMPEAGEHPTGEEMGFAVVLPPGGKASLTFNVTGKMAGEWEMGCFEQDGVHYDSGMQGTLTVKP